MTDAATRFVTPLTFEAMSGHRVLTDATPMDRRDDGGSGIAHIDWAKWADVVVLAVPMTSSTYLGPIPTLTS